MLYEADKRVVALLREPIFDLYSTHVYCMLREGKSHSSVEAEVNGRFRTPMSGLKHKVLDNQVYHLEWSLMPLSSPEIGGDAADSTADRH